MNRQPLDDATIAQLVRDAADGWTMPPVRLDAPAWRERVRSPRARRIDATRGWFGQLGRALTGAVALTVAGALVAVIITRPPADPGKSGQPSDGSTPGATDDVRASALPRLVAAGDPPSPRRVIVEVEGGDFALVDLEDGSIGTPFTGGQYGSVLQVRADGYLCLCLAESGLAAGNPTTAAVALKRFDRSGKEIQSIPIASWDGQPDPRDEGRYVPDRPRHVSTAMSFSQGLSVGFVGWSFRKDGAWQSGLLAVDLQDGTLVGRVDLPEVTAGEGDARRVVEAPRVVGSAEATVLVVGRSWYEFSPVTSDSPRYEFDGDAFTVGFTGGALGDVTELPDAAGCGDTLRFGGGLPDGGTWLACTRGAPAITVVRRIDADGDRLPDVVVSGGEGIDGDASALSADGSTLFVWNPATATMTRVDLATGSETTGEGLAAAADPGPLAAMGRWLAPVVAAKSYLRSSVVVSPDGSRVYAIGVNDGVGGSETTGSAGVFVFDATTLAALAIYQPTADFISLAVSADGRYVYAAGLAGVDALGRRRPDQGGSVTVFDTLDGSVRRIAGQLGNRMLTFGPEPLG